jgi:hypothetical protein
MARIESKANMDALPGEAKYHDAIISLIAPATPAYQALFMSLRAPSGMKIIAISEEVSNSS